MFEEIKIMNKQLNQELIDLLIKISEIEDLDMREEWFNKVIREL